MSALTEGACILSWFTKVLPHVGEPGEQSGCVSKAMHLYLMRTFSKVPDLGTQTGGTPLRTRAAPGPRKKEFVSRRSEVTVLH